MATMELNRKSHRLVRTFDTLRCKMQRATYNLDRDGQQAKYEVLRTHLADLDHGLEESSFLALVSDYLLGIHRERAQLLQENDLLRDELAYVRTKMERAEEAVVALEEERSRMEFGHELDRYDAVLAEKFTFDGQMDDWMIEQGESGIDEDDLDDDSDMDDDGSKYNHLFDSLFTRTLVVDEADSDSSDMNETDPNDTVLQNESKIEPSQQTTLRTKTAMRYFVKYLNEGRFDIAEPLCHAMIADLQNTNDTNRRDLAVALEILAMTDRDNDRYAEAAEHLQLALKIYEETLEADHPVIVATLNNLAHLYGKCEQYERAEPLCERALHIRKQRKAYRPRDVARQHNNMAIIHQQRRSLDSAIRHYKQALNIYATQPETPETLVASDKVKRRMATAMCQQNRYEEAGAVYKDILTPKRNHVKMVIPQRPIWEVAEEVERMSVTKQRQSIESYNLQYDYRDWYDCIQVYLPNAFGALKKLAFVYRKMKMHHAAKMLEHLVTITDRKKMQLKYAPARTPLLPKSFVASPRPVPVASRIGETGDEDSSGFSSESSTVSFSKNVR